MTEKKLVLVDGSYYLFRAYHAVRGLSNPRGEPSGAVYGVINMLHKLLDESRADYFAVIFDAKGGTFRSELYPQYKANRPPTPDDLVSQIQPLHDIIHAQGLPLLVIDGVEADDVIATLAQQATGEGINTVVSTGDKDLAQIVNERVHLFNSMSGTYLDRDGVKKKFGLLPEQIVDYLMLMGDSVDNIPGVPKVGPKTAVKWLLEYGSLEQIIAHAEEIKGKVGENLRAFLPQFPLSRDLVTLKYDVPLDCHVTDLQITPPDTQTLLTLYQYWNFRSWASALRKTNTDQTATNYETILTVSQLEGWLQRLRQAELIAIDTETDSLNYMQARLVGISFADAAGAAYLPLQHDYEGAPEQLPLADTLAKLKPILEDAARPKIGQHLKYDLEIFANYDIRLQGIAHDTMLASYVVNSAGTQHDLDSLAQHYLHINTIRFEDVTRREKQQIPFQQVNLEQATPYAAEDADIVLKLHPVLMEELERHPTLTKVYRDIEMPLLTVLARMERCGVCIDSAMLQQQGQELQQRSQELAKQAYDLAGEQQT